MDMFDRLKKATLVDWQSYTEHPFVHMLGDGTLSEAAFRSYLIQDYLFLIQFSRAWALAAYKSRTITDIRAAQEGLAGILNETELHIAFCKRWGITKSSLEKTQEHPSTVAYTRFVLDCGAAGDLLDLQVALAPCVIGYAEIGLQLLKGARSVIAEHPYQEWIQEYSGTTYQNVAAGARKQLDALAARGVSDIRFAELANIFGAACRLEADFWQMGLIVGKN